ncbi:mannose-binding protein /fructose-binding protein /ribose-binding protein [Roseiarcus fermentans]|uniref:Mannose-binding protein /fructose-binding protein /ribose-binding protein n=1 Tax=Roseiarcus fermentans TaxID=1473586 RepID=A0A366ETW8_9HYPH|nr:substrate-binding domain-containing protein [Roseiarcus fermentans]RBP05774.1 mannose-binding protein /fructose-binding protein /ribose-binding protein [Roseiarcus fermentans]
MKKISAILATVAAAAVTVALTGAAWADGPIVGLVTKTNTNPFFVKMKEGFEAKAKELGLTPQAYAGKADGDNDGQVAAIEQLMAAGAKGILLVPSDSTAIVPTVKKARDAGIVVITLDTPLDPVTAADALYATDNFKAGQLIGAWAKGTLGDKAATAKIATLDLAANQPSVDYLRHNGFLDGFGIKVKDPKHFSTSDSPQIVGSDVTAGSTEGGRKAMENILQKADEIDLVYAINEPAAYGGYAALKAAGKNKGVTVVAVDGGCQGVKWVKEGIIGATSQQYPLLMAADGVQAIADYVKTGKKPTSIDTGEKLVTDHPVPGVPSISVDEGMKLCWG